MNRCKWKNLENNPIYCEYHDNEWGIESHDDKYLFEMLILESFHGGLSWLIVLKKREAFRMAFDNFEVEKVATFDNNRIEKLLQNSEIIRNEAKIKSAILNAQAFIRIQKEYGSFDKYIWSFTNGEVLYNNSNEPLSTNWLSDLVSKDLKKRGFKFMGSVTTYSYLEAIGVMNNHTSYCFKAH